MTDTGTAPRKAQGSTFYLWSAVICGVVAFGGFSGTYWLQLPARTFNGPGILHLHGLLFSAWTLFFLLQAWLGARGNMAAHRAWGVAGVALATAMVFSGMAVAIRSIPLGEAAGWGVGSKAIFLTSVTSMIQFSGYVSAALLNVRRPEWHKRLMLLAGCSIIGAAVARMLFLLSGGGGPGVRFGNIAPPPPDLAAEFITEGVGIGLILAGVVRDYRTLGRPHPAYVIGLAMIVVVALLRRYWGFTASWGAIADAFVAFAG